MRKREYGGFENRQGLCGSSVEAESSGFEASLERVSVMAETNNGFIEIVK